MFRDAKQTLTLILLVKSLLDSIIRNEGKIKGVGTDSFKESHFCLDIFTGRKQSHFVKPDYLEKLIRWF